MILLKKIDNWISQFEKTMLAALLFLVIAITFWGVLDRFIFKFGIIWGEELARYTSVWAAFIGAGLGVKTGAHIGIEAFVVAMPEKFQKALELLANSICLLFCIATAYIGYTFLLKLVATHQLSSALRIPIWWVYSAVPSGCILMMLHYAIKIAEIFSDQKSKEVTQ